MFNYDLSEKLKTKIKALLKKNKPLAEQLYKKMKEVINRDRETIDFYKNLNAPIQEYKRVHVGSFVLLFKVEKEKNFILFYDFDHHDNIYKS